LTKDKEARMPVPKMVKNGHNSVWHIPTSARATLFHGRSAEQPQMSMEALDFENKFIKRIMRSSLKQSK
jgi:hypothetical protein